MKYFSKELKLSTDYINHCIRGTVLTRLDYCGFASRHTMALSGHNSESSIKKYATKCPEETLKKMSESSGAPVFKKPKIDPPATVSTPPVPNQNAIALAPNP